jgi:hypothetical protein
MEVTAVAQPDGGYGQGFGIRFGKKKIGPNRIGRISGKFG